MQSISNKDYLTKEIESWKDFANNLSQIASCIGLTNSWGVRSMFLRCRLCSSKCALHIFSNSRRNCLNDFSSVGVTVRDYCLFLNSSIRAPYKVSSDHSQAGYSSDLTFFRSYLYHNKIFFLYALSSHFLCGHSIHASIDVSHNI